MTNSQAKYDPEVFALHHELESLKKGTAMTTVKYNLTPDDLQRVKKAAKYAGLPWQSVAARPSTALDFCVQVEAEQARKHEIAEKLAAESAMEIRREHSEE